MGSYQGGWVPLGTVDHGLGDTTVHPGVDPPVSLSCRPPRTDGGCCRWSGRRAAGGAVRAVLGGAVCVVLGGAGELAGRVVACGGLLVPAGELVDAGRFVAWGAGDGLAQRGGLPDDRQGWARAHGERRGFPVGDHEPAGGGVRVQVAEVVLVELRQGVPSQLVRVLRAAVEED